MIHILFMILKALGILLLVLLFLVLLIVCTVLFLPFCYRAQVLKEEEGFACVKASGRVSWLFGAVALTASYEEQKPEAQILLFGASLETWKRTRPHRTWKICWPWPASLVCPWQN